MMLGAGAQQSIRKYVGAIKDSTSVGLAKVNSDYKELDIAIVKATRHFEDPSKEKHVRAIFAAISAGRPRADIVYCIQALGRRLTKTHNWAVALKTLIIIHRALKEVNSTFQEELIDYGRSRCYMLNLTHFRDDSSHDAWEYSSWVRKYALFLEEKLECFRVLTYDIEIETSKTRDLNVVELLEQLPTLQQLLFRLLECEPEAAAMNNYIIQLALSMVAGESIKIYNAISDGTTNLVDKFFGLQRHIAVRALKIYRRAGQQVDRLSEFYEICNRLNVWRGEHLTKIEQSSALLQTMEEYVKNTKSFILQKDQVRDQITSTPKEVMEQEHTPEEMEEARPTSPPEPVKLETPLPEPADFLGLSDYSNSLATESDDQSPEALDIDLLGCSSTAIPGNLSAENGTTSWETALLVSGSTESNSDSSKLAGGFDRLTLDSFYDEATRTGQNVSYNPWAMPPVVGNTTQQMDHDPFYPSNSVVAHPYVQMYTVAQEHGFMCQQQLVMDQQLPHQPLEIPFNNPNATVGFDQTSKI